MGKTLDTHVTLATVNGALWSQDHAREADFEPRDPGFLAIEAIHDQIILEISAKPHRVLVIGLLRDEARVGGGRLVEEKVYQLP